MEVIDNQNSSEYLKNSIVYLYCVEESVQKFTIDALPLIKIKCKCAHIAMTDNITVRRYVLIVDDGLDVKLQPFSSPLLIRIESCCDFTVNMNFVYYVVYYVIVAHC
jgi:hypothetical protein